MDGVRLKYDGLKATNIKGFIGKSRTHFTYAEESLEVLMRSKY